MNAPWVYFVELNQKWSDYFFHLKRKYQESSQYTASAIAARIQNKTKSGTQQHNIEFSLNQG